MGVVGPSVELSRAGEPGRAERAASAGMRAARAG